MKNKRLYNTFFNTHTVSGIVISVALFVCFLAGAFALFQEDINKWEATTKATEITVDYHKVLATLKNVGYTMEGRTFFMQKMDNPTPFVMVISRPVRSTSNTKLLKTNNNLNPNGFISVKIDTKTYRIIDRESAEPKNHLGTFLYHLHYFDQIPKIGMYLAGLISLFFLFAIVTGTIIHWKKISTNFFTFRLKASLKNLWTDAHVALGIIGLPFQFMYAITGTLLGLSILVLLPSSMVLYNGNQGKLLKHLAPAYTSFEKANSPLTNTPNLNELITKAKKELNVEKALITSVNLTNYNDDNSHFMIEFRKSKSNSFYDDAHIIYKLKDETVVQKKLAENSSYKGGAVLHTVRKLHFGQFGGYFIKLLFFLLSIITCFVILSGVMVWLKSRDNKLYQAKRKFNKNVGAIYLGVSMGLFPAIAFFFCITKIFPLEIENRFEIMSNTFFIFWLAYVIYAYLIKDLHKITKTALFLSGVLGLLVPFLNGLQSNLWLWKSLQLGYVNSFFVDVSWLLLGILLIIISMKIKRINNPQGTS